MRIGIEVFGTQSNSRHRGVGRYVFELTNALLSLGSPHEFILYAEADAPADMLPLVAHAATLRMLRADPARGERDMTDAFRRLLSANPDHLDLMLITNPLELRPDFLTPAKPLNRLKMASVVYDLIPLIFQNHYYHVWPGPEFIRRYQRGLEQLKTYDVLLAISEATRNDFLNHLALPPEKVVNVSTASEAACWKPHRGKPTAKQIEELAGLGIAGPFVYSMGAMEYRKNLGGLLDAFSKLPDVIRSTHQLVVTYAMSPLEEHKVQADAETLGIGDRLVMTPRLSDELLAILYQQCEVFVFPSIYEGFGLPVLEAMRCGAAVIAGDNSSQIEVVGDAGLLADVGDSRDLLAKILQVLENPAIATDLRRKAVTQSGLFRWSNVADKTIQAIEALAKPKTKLRLDATRLGRSRKPRIAYFSPFPPLLSGVGDYSERLIEELRAEYRVDLYHDSGYEPSLKLQSAVHACHDHRLFPRNDSILHYHSIVYQMGNSHLHKYIYELLPKFPGVVTLHDFNLAGFQYWDSSSSGAGLDGFCRVVEEYDPDLAPGLAESLAEWDRTPGGVIDQCALAGIALNQRIFRHALEVVVHSPWCVRQARSIHGDLADKTQVVPHGAAVIRRTPEEIAALRGRYGLPRDGLLIGNFGIIHPTKMNVESLRAFAEVARENPDALFLLVGTEHDNGAARKEVAELGLSSRVRFFAPKPTAEFIELAGIVDIGINLRRPPTNGETSGALLHLLCQGVATIVSDIGTFGDYPETVVRKVTFSDDRFSELKTCLLELARNPDMRHELGASGLRHVTEIHSWRRAMNLYAEVIERCGRGGPQRPPSAIYQGPHSARAAVSVTGRTGMTH